MTDIGRRELSPPNHHAPIALVVLAAGHGTRMRSALPKPLHPVAGVPMVSRVLAAGSEVRPASVVLVVGTGTVDLAQRAGVAVDVVMQDPPRGTGDAVRCALAAIGDAGWILVLYADHPLLDASTVTHLVNGALQTLARVTVLTCLLPDPGSYGRIGRDPAGRPIRIVERADDTPEARVGPTEINSGMMVLEATWARDALQRLQPSSATGEYYLTDLVEMAVAEGASGDDAWPVATVLADPAVALGVNDRVQLAAADAEARSRIRSRLMLGGVTLVGPETIFVDEDVEVGPDTTLFPFTTLLAGTRVGARCTIGPHATLDGARIGNDAVVRASTVVHSSVGDGSDVGPYAHLRGGTEIGPHVHVGNYAELKNAVLHEGVKVGHVSYVGDAEVGAETNIGAGTITANYDGVAKHRTEIGPSAFIGSDSVLVAPVRIGEAARTGAGAVVTRNVPDGATVVGVPARVVPQRGAPQNTGARDSPSSAAPEGDDIVPGTNEDRA